LLRKPASILLLSLLAISALALTYTIQPVKASGTIYIRADGSIDPLTAPIYTADNITYMLTGDISSGGDGIVVERDNIFLNGAGYTVQGTGSGIGISLAGRTNATLQDTAIKAFDNGIVLGYSSNISIAENNITNNKVDGIVLGYSSNISIAENTITANSFDGIVLSYSSNISIAENTITANSFDGTFLYSSPNNSIARNSITNNGYGVYLYSSPNNSIARNNITNNGYGVYLYSSSDNSIAENSITASTDDGVHLVSSSNISIARNSITANSFDGVYLYSSPNNSIAENSITANNWYGIDLDYSYNVSIAGNTITANNWYGVYLYSSPNNSIVGDNITNSFDGIYLYSSPNNSITENNITNNGGGLLLGSSPSNSIYHNNFVNNTVQAIIRMTASNTWDNGYPSGGNYWSDYTGADFYGGPYQNETASDGIGDSPYVIDASNQDNYPLMSPYVPFENQTIYIRADGSIDPSGAPILREGDLYTLTDNITCNAGGIVIERDNMTLDGAGYVLQGGGSGKGIDLADISNVTIKNTNVKSFEKGVYLYSSSNNAVSGNNITANSGDGIYFDRCGSDNTVSGNNITANNGYGIDLYISPNNNISGNNITNNGEGIELAYSSSNNSISGNDITNDGVGVYVYYSPNNSISGNNLASNAYGIYLDCSSNNSISGNNITNNGYGIYFCYSSDNKFCHNSFINNTNQVYFWPSSANIWDDGYPSGGNYWSDYTGTDLFSGPYQNETGSDGIGDTPYVIDTNNKDNYPLMKPCSAYDVALAGLTSAPTVICQGYGCLITVKVSNQGDFAETTVTVYANMTDTGNVTMIRTFENVILDSRDSTTLTFMWNTSGFDLGNYTISAYATPVPGEMNVADNTFVGDTVQIIQTTGGGGGKMPYMD